jgi:hypothetical protein
MSRSRAVCYTLNNPTEEELTQLRAIINDATNKIRYHVFQLESAPTTGTIHVQGYISATDAKVFATWKRILGTRVHFVVAKGDAASNKAYCSKDSDRVPGTLVYEEGEIPQPGKRNDVLAFTQACRDPKRTIGDIFDEFSCEVLRFPRAMSLIRSIIATPRDFKTLGFWFYGRTGTGKSFTIRELAPNAYWKSADNKWWDGYDPIAHTDVVIDDFRPNMCTFAQLLRIIDQYPFSVESKGGTVVFRPRRVFISTPRSPTETWTNVLEEDIQQIVRRLETIVEFCPGRIKRFDKGSTVDLDPNPDFHPREPTGGGGPAPTTQIDDSDEEGIVVRRNNRPRIIAQVDEFNM